MLYPLLGTQNPLFDQLLIWLVAVVAGGIGVVSLLNMLDMLFEADVR